MAFRKLLNRHDGWQVLCQEHESLLQGLPEFAVRCEEAFRALVTDGVATSPCGEEARLSRLSAEEFSHLRQFIYDRSGFDMDVELFEAFHRERALRRDAGES